MTSNHILKQLSAADFRLLELHLRHEPLPVRKQLQARNARTSQVYFLESGIASVVANGEDAIEVGIIGREGMTGISLALGSDDRAPHETFMQIAGSGFALGAAELREAIRQSITLHHVLLRYVHTFLIQATQTALANGRSKMEERLSRWLLLAHDRIDGDELALTHEFLGMMLGVQRSGVTIAVQELERRGLIGTKRGLIIILNRAGLKKNSNGTYIDPAA
jgi:CRP-like cAMP-binding protein